MVRVMDVMELGMKLPVILNGRNGLSIPPVWCVAEVD